VTPVIDVTIRVYNQEGILAAAVRRLHAYLRSGFISFVFLFVATLFFHVWGLDRNGWANAWYAAAVGAGIQRWKARRLPNSAAP